jgi:hypothetical protein
MFPEPGTPPPRIGSKVLPRELLQHADSRLRAAERRAAVERGATESPLPAQVAKRQGDRVSSQVGPSEVKQCRAMAGAARQELYTDEPSMTLTGFRDLPGVPPAE